MPSRHASEESRTATRTGLAILAATLLIGSPASGPVSAVGGVACDAKVRILTTGEVTDGGEFYRGWDLLLEGTGYPPSTALVYRVVVDGVGLIAQQILSDSDGYASYNIMFIGGHFPPYDEPREFTITLSEYLGDPGSCSDTVVMTRLPDPPFDDVVFSEFLDEIIWAHDAGLFVGCRPRWFCGLYALPREQAAVVTVRAFALPATTEDFFVDDEGTRFEWAINRLAAAGLATGCSSTAFCPTRLMTRGEAASFLVAALELPPSDVDQFADDNGSSHESAINALAAAGVTNGCSSLDPSQYCPDEYMTREQFAVFMFRALS
jgi:hypothetical protein